MCFIFRRRASFCGKAWGGRRMSQLYFLRHSTPLHSPYSTQQLCPLFLRGITPGHQKGRSILNFNNVDIMRQSGGGGSPSVYSVGSRRRGGGGGDRARQRGQFIKRSLQRTQTSHSCSFLHSMSCYYRCAYNISRHTTWLWKAPSLRHKSVCTRLRCMWYFPRFLGTYFHTPASWVESIIFLHFPVFCKMLFGKSLLPYYTLLDAKSLSLPPFLSWIGLPWWVPPSSPSATALTSIPRTLCAQNGSRKERKRDARRRRLLSNLIFPHWIIFSHYTRIPFAAWGKKGAFICTPHISLVYVSELSFPSMYVGNLDQSLFP